MKIGVWELVVVFIVALLVIGPDKLPEYAKKLGEALRQFKKYSSEATKEIRESVVEPLQEAQRPLKEAMEPLTDLEKSVRGEMDDLKKSFEEIGKPPRIKPDTGTPEPTGPVVEAPADAGAVNETPEASGPEAETSAEAADEKIGAAASEPETDKTRDDTAAEPEKSMIETGSAPEPENCKAAEGAAAAEVKADDTGALIRDDGNADPKIQVSGSSAEA